MKPPKNPFVVSGYESLQFLLLQAISKERQVSQPTAKEFIERHRLGQPSSVIRSIESLLEKEMIFREKGVYCVYDVFFAKWLERQ